jgi:hypothetical protein
MLGFGALVVAAAIAVLLLIHYRSAANTAGSLQAGSGSAQSASGQGIPTDAKALGIAAGGSLPELSPQALNTRMAGIAASGATWVRFDFDWSQIQPDNATAYNWAPYDSIVAAAGAQHLHVLGIIDFTPAWARLNGCGSKQCPPASPAAYGHFAAALAGRYASKGVHDWEIWNEPNSPQFWQPGANPKAYVSLLSAAYSALHAADSHAYVLTGGLSPQPDNATAMSPVHFLTELYTDGAKGHFDAVADHPYTFPLTPASKADDAWTQMAAASHSLRTVMIADGDANKKIWITEFGAPTGGPGPISTLANPNLAAQPYVVDQGLQAKILSDAMAAYRAYSWAGPFFYYSYEDAGTDQSTNENFFGLVTAAGTPKQAYAVFQQAAAALKR